MAALTAMVLSAILLMTFAMIAVTSAQETPQVYAPEEKPFGLGYGQWSIKW